MKAENETHFYEHFSGLIALILVKNLNINKKIKHWTSICITIIVRTFDDNDECVELVILLYYML